MNWILIKSTRRKSLWRQNTLTFCRTKSIALFMVYQVLMIDLGHFSLALTFPPFTYFRVTHRPLRLREPRPQLALSFCDPLTCARSPPPQSRSLSHSLRCKNRFFWGFSFLPLYFTCKPCHSSLPHAWLILSKYLLNEWMSPGFVPFSPFCHSHLHSHCYYLVLILVTTAWQWFSFLQANLEAPTN